MSFESQRRQRGKQERNSDLLIEPESGAPEKVDMVISGEQRDQGEQDAGDQRDTALEVEPEQHRSQPVATSTIVRLFCRGHPWNRGLKALRIDPAVSRKVAEPGGRFVPRWACGRLGGGDGRTGCSPDRGERGRYGVQAA